MCLWLFGFLLCKIVCSNLLSSFFSIGLSDFFLSIYTCSLSTLGISSCGFYVFQICFPTLHLSFHSLIVPFC